VKERTIVLNKPRVLKYQVGERFRDMSLMVFIIGLCNVEIERLDLALSLAIPTEGVFVSWVT
jgi:hypothetical protein